MITVLDRWKAQHLSRPDWAEHYFQTQDLPSRALVLEALSWMQPWETVVELGCNSGPMLAMIQQSFPRAGIRGVEPNAVAAQACHDRLSLPVAVESLEDWLQGPERADVLVTHYTLAYISPEQIRPILALMAAKAKRGVVIAEPMGEEQLIWSFPEWSHDYGTHLISLGKDDFWAANVAGVGNLNGVVGVRW